ncbi:twin-arginine translocase TatA/TatE family subunit [Pectinatus brassicae]|uniref:Sec-independent protein translocase protein TatA n=1 Tax=Pectinatus brassicae TaxID=862415 RepID=A0A840US56_9FIRM|nr:twin-arginine translocase TatA/TatE family subunit [Pectinatus brassicae]MBB5335365.1 sec-independent protein translocase protein TatA [Pectinatus brassicae]
MFGIGVPELIVILIIGLVLFGPGKLPEVGRAVGKSINELKKATSGINDVAQQPQQNEQQVQQQQMQEQMKQMQQQMQQMQEQTKNVQPQPAQTKQDTTNDK